MTIAEAIALREKEEKICQTCTRFVSGTCSQCNHNSLYVRRIPILERLQKEQDETLNNYR